MNDLAFNAPADALSSRWAKIKDFPLYVIGDQGEVVSLHFRSPRLLRTSISGQGYRKVTLVNPDRSKHHRNVHALVAMAFIGDRPLGFDICHNNGDRSDNRFENLRYASRKENHADKLIHGTDASGERHPGAKLSWPKVRTIGKAAKIMPQKMIAQIYAVSPMAVSRIVNNKAWIQR